MHATVDVECVDFRRERLAHDARGAGKRDRHAAFVDALDGEALRLQPGDDRVDVLLRRSEQGAEVARAQPLMILRRGRILLRVDQRFERDLPIRRTPQLQQQVGQNEVVGDAAAIVAGIERFGTCIAGKFRALRRIDRLRDQHPGRRRCGQWRSRGLQREQQRDQ